jgi:hypothetical protein
MSRRRVLQVLALLVAGAMLLPAIWPAAARGQAAWEYTPYQVRVWIALEETPQLPDELVPSLAEFLTRRAESVRGAVWQLEAQAAPAAIRSELLSGLESLTAERLAAVAKDGLSGDKLYLAAIRVAPQGFDLALREVDSRSRQLGPVARGSAASLDLLPTVLWDLIAAEFTPLVRIERVTDDQVVARLRAGGLVIDPASTALVQPGAVLRPVIRRNDRTGQPAKVGGINAVPWTLMRVEQRSNSLLECKVFSGYRGAIPSRGGARTDRLALLVRPRFERTSLVLESRSASKKRLAGYEVSSRLPEETDPVPLGATDSFGTLDLRSEGGGLRMLYVKNGRQLLARLPIVPGQAEQLVASLADDEGRLQAEGFVMALQSRAIDLVARRQIIAARLRARLKDGKIDEAQTLLEDFRKLETRIDLSRSLDEAKQGLVAGDRVTQARIDKLFADAGKLLAVKQLSDELLNELTRELAAAKGGGAVASKS